MSIRFRLCGLLYPLRSPAIWLLLVSISLGGCGVGSKQKLQVQTEPVGAFVDIDGKFIGNSPVDLKVNRQVPHSVVVRKVGFLSERVMVYPSLQEGGEPKVVFGPLRESGYYRNLEPNPVVVEMVYEGLANYGETLTQEEAESLVVRIQREREEGQLSDGDAAIALSQVQDRMQ